ncbi:hypothetical protein F5X96DRAFT_108187 [Biscogniauxia mediterranea]|nr:hypothetical protein F5X96DRAFT_108187 [Biscogniauxia mediterranea]
MKILYSSLPLARGRDPPCPVVSYRRSRMHLAVIFVIISCWASLGAAISLDAPPRPTETSLLIDTRVPVFADGHWHIMSDEEARLLRRKEQGSTSTTDSSSEGFTTTVEKRDSSSTTTTETTTEPTTTTSTATALPSPFDGALGADFASGDSCPGFFNDFLSNSTFQSCYPASLLLKSSQSFFQAQRSFFDITQVLTATCAVDVDTCTDYFDQLARDLISDDNCGQDYRDENALVMQAYRGMTIYNVVYKATCLTDPETSAFCYANAVTNSTTASNVFLYYLPYNSTLRDSAAPACDSCTSQTMGIYQAATSDRSSGIAYTYQSAAEHINSICGSGFVNETLAAAVEGSSAGRMLSAPPSTLLLLSFVVMALSHWIL